MPQLMGHFLHSLSCPLFRAPHQLHRSSTHRPPCLHRLSCPRRLLRNQLSLVFNLTQMSTNSESLFAASCNRRCSKKSDKYSLTQLKASMRALCWMCSFPDPSRALTAITNFVLPGKTSAKCWIEHALCSPANSKRDADDQPHQNFPQAAMTAIVPTRLNKTQNDKRKTLQQHEGDVSRR